MRTVLDADRAQLARLKELVLEACGFHLENEREASLRAALRERMAALGLGTAAAYLKAMQADEAELDRFVERLTVNETYFMREPGHLRLIVQRLVPELLAARTEPVRILCAGCSSGEEPYSIAILLQECYGDACAGLFSIAGVDIDARAIAAARRGVYGRNSFRGMDPELLARHFDETAPGRYQLREPARRLATFETVNLLAESFPPFAQDQDLILYRNVSIYFPRAVQRKVFGRLAGALRESGYLIVGATESMHHDLGILPLVEREGLYLFRKQPGHSGKEPRAGLRPPPRTAGEPPPSRPTVIRTAEPPRQAARDAGGQDVRRLFEKALGLARGGHRKDALGAVEELLGRDPACLRALALKASLLMDCARYEEAQGVCEEVLERDALCLEASLMLGVLARRAGDDDAAHRRFREAMYLDSDCWLAHYYLAEILARKGDAKRSRAGYASALRILENGESPGKGRSLYPLAFNAGQFIAICRHKLSLPKENA